MNDQSNVARDPPSVAHLRTSLNDRVFASRKTLALGFVLPSSEWTELLLASEVHFRRLTPVRARARVMDENIATLLPKDGMRAPMFSCPMTLRAAKSADPLHRHDPSGVNA